VAFATLAAIELVQARRDDMPPARLSEAFFHATMLQEHGLSDEEAAEVPEGGVLLHQAWRALAEHGFLGSEHAPYTPDWTLPNAAEALDGALAKRAAVNRMRPVGYGTIGEPVTMAGESVDVITPGEGTASKVLDFLRSGLPVAVGVPLFQHASGLSNWTLPSAIRTGCVPCPEDAGAPLLEGPRSDGHVVCITGFTPDPSEPLGGWFIFRNSWGLEYASHAAIPVAGRTSGVRGYGCLSATHLDLYCWEYLVPGETGAGAIS